MLTFLRGPGSFMTNGQVYVKLLPDGEPQQLTKDDLTKMNPVFTPDGSRIAYTAGGYDTWLIPVLGGGPTRWLPNASAPAWSSRKTIVFSEIIDRLAGNHRRSWPPKRAAPASATYTCRHRKARWRIARFHPPTASG